MAAPGTGFGGDRAGHSSVFFFLASMFNGADLSPGRAPREPETTTYDQGWSEDQAQEYHAAPEAANSVDPDFTARIRAHAALQKLHLTRLRKRLVETVGAEAPHTAATTFTGLWRHTSNGFEASPLMTIANLGMPGFLAAQARNLTCELVPVWAAVRFHQTPVVQR